MVLKFGGSVLGSERDLITASDEVRSWIDRGFKVAAVVSAFEGVTDTLVRQAKAYGDERTDPNPASRALLTGTGELTSASLLGLALHRAGIRGIVAAPWTIGLRATGAPLDAFPESLDRNAVEKLFQNHDAIVVPGFVGLDEHNQLVLLGRGGSDLSALFVAERLGAEVCRLVKDVDGLYEYDPALARSGERPQPRRYATLPWSEALKLDGGIVQHKAVKFASERKLSFEVGAMLASEVSVVGDVAIGYASSIISASGV